MSQKKEGTSTETNVAGKSISRKIAGTVVYIGPDIPNIVKQNTIYNNGLPEILREEMKKNATIKSLVVPIERLAASSAELCKQGSALSTIYRKVREG